MEKKYELLKRDCIKVRNKKLYRVRALKTFTTIDKTLVKKGELGGFIENESNLSHKGVCWVGENACVYENAVILDNARIGDKAIIRGNSNVFQNATILGLATIEGDSLIYGNAYIDTNSLIKKDAEIFDSSHIFYIQLMGLQGYHFTTYRTKSKDYSIQLSFKYPPMEVEELRKNIWDSKDNNREFKRFNKTLDFIKEEIEYRKDLEKIKDF